MAEQQQYIPLTPADFIAGGLVSDVDVQIKSIQYQGWDYNGAISGQVLAVRMGLALLDDKLNATTDPELEQFWSCGPDLEDSGIRISEDGYGCLPGPSKSLLTKNSNFHILLTSLWGNGMPENQMADGRLSHLLNAKIHIVRVPAPKREGLAVRAKKDREFESQVLVVNKIHSAAWTKGGAKARPAAQAPGSRVDGSAAAAPATAATGDDASSTAIANINAVLAETPMISLDDLKVAIFQQHMKSKADVRNSVVKLITEAFLTEAGFKVKGDVVMAA